MPLKLTLTCGGEIIGLMMNQRKELIVKLLLHEENKICRRVIFTLCPLGLLSLQMLRCRTSCCTHRVT